MEQQQQNKSAQRSQKQASQWEAAPGLSIPQGSLAKDFQDSLADVRSSLGFVPSFVNRSPYQALSGAWLMMRDVRFAESTVIEPKYKSLISLGVGAQIPCAHCTYFETESAKHHQASQQEISEAVYSAALTKVGSAILNGAQVDYDLFCKEASQAIQFMKGRMQKTGTQEQAEDVYVKKFGSAQEVYKDIEATIGFVPKFILAFPQTMISGFWSDFKGLLMNPRTAVPGKYKELVGLAVASVIPCRYSTFFHTESARLHNASDEEIHEAIAIGAMTAHWGTVFNGLRVDQKAFEKEFAALWQ